MPGSPASIGGPLHQGRCGQSTPSSPRAVLAALTTPTLGVNHPQTCRGLAALAGLSSLSQLAAASARSVRHPCQLLCSPAGRGAGLDRVGE